MPHRKLNVPERGMLDAHEKTLAARGYVADAAQMAAATRLQQLYTELLHFKVARGSPLRRLLRPPVPPRGYIFGAKNEKTGAGENKWEMAGQTQEWRGLYRCS